MSWSQGPQLVSVYGNGTLTTAHTQGIGYGLREVTFVLRLSSSLSFCCRLLWKSATRASLDLSCSSCSHRRTSSHNTHYTPHTRLTCCLISSICCCSLLIVSSAPVSYASFLLNSSELDCSCCLTVCFSLSLDCSCCCSSVTSCTCDWKSRSILWTQMTRVTIATQDQEQCDPHLVPGLTMKSS